MFYAKNLPMWERIVRLAGATAMALCSWKYSSTPLGSVLGVAAVVTAVIALVGFCPMCALAGRKLKARQD